MCCKECGSIYVVNKTHQLCDKHNKERLNSQREEKPKKAVKSTVKTAKKRKETLNQDKETYLKVFNSKPHICENCGEQLPDIFEVDDRIIYIAQYSHILSKGAHPKIRHDIENFNRLCIKCHNLWEFGERKTMKIWENNQKIIEKLKEKYNK